MTDLASGDYALPWEADVKVTDGTGLGFPKPSRRFGEREPSQ
jgi:formamidase